MELDSSRTQRTLSWTARLLSALQMDGPLLAGLSMLALISLIVLYSASGSSMSVVFSQALKFLFGTAVMLAVAQLPRRIIRNSAPWLYAVGLILLLMVMIKGSTALGAQRWLDLKFVRFQPSEIMKLAMPLFCAWYVHERPLPPSLRDIAILTAVVLVPTALIAKQPDLGTALLVVTAGGVSLLLSGLQKRYILGVVLLMIPAAWVGWTHMHDYQRQRVITFLEPQSDPLGSGYHIIQSQIAIGSGGVFGKGYLNGSQAQLEFLPERATDFIFAVIGEEWGLLGLVTILFLYLFIIARCLYIAANAQDTFSRILCGSLALTFAVYVFVNTGMVTGLLPVVGVPLPLISFGGSSMVTLMAGFGFIMAIHARRRLVGR
ncbi:MAG TPA: rod shape-determining protein RodA [Steroidobacteraceae bacterium]|nr:rod shape-determining protein RodA [Steroidobacteraceae bacterium]